VEGKLCLPLAVLAVALVAAVPTAAKTEAAGKSAPAEPPAVEVAAHVDRDRVTIGTPLKYTLEIRANKGVEVVVPLLAGSLGDFSIVDFGQESAPARSSKVISRRWYKLIAYSPGQFIIPGPTIRYRTAGGELQSINANDLPVTVVSLLGKDADLSKIDIRDIKQPLEVPFDWRPVGLLAAGAMAVGLLTFAAYRWANRGHVGSAAVPAPLPHELALEGLARLRRRRLVEEGTVEEYYIQLSGIIRHYLEGRFRLHAPEMTTEEFLQAVQQGSSLNPDHRRLLGEFLSESDLVKFARHTPAPEEAERAFEAARRFVDESRPEA